MVEKVLARMSKYKAVRLVNKRDQDRSTPLHYAVRYHHVETAKILVEYGASGFFKINSKN